MRKNGFTLIEFLTIIIFLAIIMIITIPLVLKVIKDSKLTGYIDSVYGLVSLAQEYQFEQDNKEDIVIDYTNNENTDILKSNGVRPDGGNLLIRNDGKVALKLWNEEINVCITKDFEADEVIVDEQITTKNKCYKDVK